jgi:hypothetical protein
MGRPSESFDHIRDAIVADIQQFDLLHGKPHVLERLQEFGVHKRHAVWLYENFSGYLRCIYDLLAVNNGTIEASGVYFYGVVLLREANHKLRDAILRVERIVDHILAPATLPLTEERLRECGWPEESVSDLDENWL